MTEVSDVFNIENQGTQTVEIDLDDDDVQAGVSFELPSDTTLSPGESLNVGVTVDTLNEDPEEGDGTLLISAEA